MNAPALADLTVEAERELLAILGEHFTAKQSETFAESSYRGGFRLVLADGQRSVEVLYSDMQLEIRFNGVEIFGTVVHEGFQGNMFSREHLREYLPRIAASAAAGAAIRHAQGWPTLLAARKDSSG